VTPYQLGPQHFQATSHFGRVGSFNGFNALTGCPASLIQMHPKVIPKRKLHEALQKHIQKLQKPHSNSHTLFRAEFLPLELILFRPERPAWNRIPQTIQVYTYLNFLYLRTAPAVL
jgi:hypothetical protein